MHTTVPGPTWLHKYFSPENRIAEVICGLIMVLSFTATTSGTFEGTTPHALLIAVIGCNIAWGVVDGVTYILGNLLNRGARSRLILALQRDHNDGRANALLKARIDSVIGDALTPQQCQQIQQWVIEGVGGVQAEPVRIRRDDLLTGLACFLIVFGAALPVLVPFILIENEAIALRACNGLILAMLFAMGWRWAGFANMSRIKAGLSLLGVGLVLVVITVALGG
jgi:VIT1/CCC1 family predicted Fe2+/Mn2+ transporter